MKKIIISALCILAINGFSQDEKTWRIGVQIGSQNNHSRFTGGMSDANARFNHNTHGAGALNVIWRYDLNKHWMLMTGLGINSFGFQYSLSQNYSLANYGKHNNQYVGVQSSFGALEIPAMVFYKFNPNCKNGRWLVGAGFAQTFIGAQTNSNDSWQGGESVAVVPATNDVHLNSTSVAKGGNYWFFRWSVGRERTYKNGGILNASILFNVGFNKIGESTVNYTVDNKDYTHSFTNTGNFVGFRLAYFFKPFHQPYTKAKSAVVK